MAGETPVRILIRTSFKNKVAAGFFRHACGRPLLAWLAPVAPQ